ncbi:hypothetical protein KQH27_00670 [bacterium]|nr:hypothetical protein [bacterium]
MNEDVAIWEIRLTSGKKLTINMHEDDIDNSMKTIANMIQTISVDCFIQSAMKLDDYMIKPKNIQNSIREIILQEINNIVNQIRDEKHILTWFLSELVYGDFHEKALNFVLNQMDNLPSA